MKWIDDRGRSDWPFVTFFLVLCLVILVSAFLASCSARDVDPCSPLAAAVIDQTCVETVDQVMRRECPEDTGWTACPKAVYALAACDLIIEEHARRCSP